MDCLCDLRKGPQQCLVQEHQQRLHAGGVEGRGRILADLAGASRDVQGVVTQDEVGGKAGQGAEGRSAVVDLQYYA
jgi:hypothetical protein